ncbi:toxin-antitoxin system TumE family protein [Agrobacterium pusense]|uniref:toxin-antitoxin system TumE family protein n=1 Tax=Agrobacterium pusense TaxID=648995 RepID=UPI0031F38DB3
MECSKTVLPDGAIVVWNVREPVPGSTHLFKYRLFFGTDGRRIVSFDNERHAFRQSLRARGSLHLFVARTAFFCHHPQKVGID